MVQDLEQKPSSASSDDAAVKQIKYIHFPETFENECWFSIYSRGVRMPRTQCAHTVYIPPTLSDWLSVIT